MVLNVRVQPRAAKNEIMETDDNRLKIKVTAPPSDGQANRLVVKVLADRLKIGKSKVTIITGQQSRDKRIRIDGLTPARIRSLLKV